MTVTTLDHVPPMPDTRTTATAAGLVPPRIRHVHDSDSGHGAEAEHVRSLAEVVHALAEACQPQPEPVPDALTRYAALLYSVTGWENLAYAALAASETPDEAEEHRRIARRRRPCWADED